MTHKGKWLLLAPLGLVTIGAGASMVHWAGTLKDRHAPAKKWLAAGTAALAVLNAGLSLFGQSIIEKVLHEVREKPQPPAVAPETAAPTLLTPPPARPDHAGMD